MPTSRELLAGKGGGNALNELVIPEVPYRPLPPKAAKRNPELDQWNRDNHAALSNWREKSNVALARLTPQQGAIHRT
jgi:hypothetical protein